MTNKVCCRRFVALPYLSSNGCVKWLFSFCALAISIIRTRHLVYVVVNVLYSANASVLVPVVIPTLETVGDRRQARPSDSVLGPGGYANTRVRSDHCATMLQREDYL